MIMEYLIFPLLVPTLRSASHELRLILLRIIKRMDNMMINLIPYIIFSLPVLVGALIMSKPAGWPSEAEKKNKGLRALKTSLGGTMFVIGLALLFFYHISPDTFLS